MGVPEEVAEILLRSGAVAISLDVPFVYVSGIRSPIYTDNRLLISLVPERRRVSELLAAAAPPGVEVVAGTATAGIPWAAWVAERLDLPMVYVRSEAKAHGKGRRVEGKLAPGQRVLVVEDLITTGGSALRTVEALREEGALVEDVVAIYSYELDAAARRLAAAGLRVQALTGLGVLLDVAVQLDQLDATQRDEVASALAAAFGGAPPAP